MTAQVLHQNLEKEIGVVVARRDTAVVNLQCIGSDGRLPTPYCDKDGPLAGQFSVLSAVPLPHGFAKLLSLRVSDSSECMCRGLRCWYACRPCATEYAFPAMLASMGHTGSFMGRVVQRFDKYGMGRLTGTVKMPDSFCAMEPVNGIRCSRSSTTKLRPLITRTHHRTSCLLLLAVAVQVASHRQLFAAHSMPVGMHEMRGNVMSASRAALEKLITNEQRPFQSSPQPTSPEAAGGRQAAESGAGAGPQPSGTGVGDPSVLPAAVKAPLSQEARLKERLERLSLLEVRDAVSSNALTRLFRVGARIPCLAQSCCLG